MKRIFITLITTIAVFVATLIVTNIYTNKKAEKAAEQLNDIMLDRFCKELEGDILLTQRSAYNFLSFLFYSESTDKSDQLIINRDYLIFFKQYVYDYLEQFINLNQYYQSAMFVVDSTVCHDYFNMQHAFVPTIEHGDTERHELSGVYDFMKSEHYQKLKKSRKTFWAMPSNKSRVQGLFINIYVPLALDDNRFFGAFIISIGVDAVSEKLRYHLPYGEERSQMQLLDEHGKVFASYPKEPIQKDDDKEYCTYVRNTDYAPWTIKTTCLEDAVYQEAETTNWVITLTSIFGMFLMFFCCYIIFRQMSKNMRQKAAAEDELKLAANLQMSILKPTEYTVKDLHLDNFLKPAITAGGDLYDYIFKNGKLIFIIGDVSGKGMSAALFMTQVVSLFRNAVRYTQDPVGIMSQINDSISENNPSMTFCTAIIGCVHGDSITLCNAGHTRPIIIPADSRKPEYKNLLPNIALGLFEGFNYRCDEIPFASQDTLILYTDGVTEAKDEKDKYFKEDSLIGILKDDNTISNIVKEIRLFTGKAPQSDDITICHLTRS